MGKNITITEKQIIATIIIFSIIFLLSFIQFNDSSETDTFKKITGSFLLSSGTEDLQENITKTETEPEEQTEDTKITEDNNKHQYQLDIQLSFLVQDLVLQITQKCLELFM